MPLHEHFHPPLRLRRAWSSFYSAWATFLAADLNHRLPPKYFAEPLVQFAIEIDLASWDELGGPAREEPLPLGAWLPAAPLRTLPLVPVTDSIEVRILRHEGGPILAGAIELVSPAKQDRPETRDAFVSKCANYLRQEVGFVVVDVVTERRAELHRELLERIAPDETTAVEADLYAAAYRPVRRGEQTNVEIWHGLCGCAAESVSPSNWKRPTNSPFENCACQPTALDVRRR